MSGAGQLEAGMCFHLQSGVWMESFGAAVSESFALAEHRGERLCDMAREVIVRS